MLEVEKIVTVPIDQNAYIFYEKGRDTAVVVDPSFNVEPALRFLKEQELKCKGILLTHGHFDHIAGVDALRQSTGAAVYIHKNDADMLTAPARNMGTLIHRDVQVAPAEHTFSGDADLSLGGLPIRVLETPGHTKGSVCYMAENALFTGDTLFQLSIGRTDLPTGDSAAMKKSLLRLSKIQGEYTIYPGHGRSTSLQYEITNNPYLGDKKWFLS